MPEKLDLYRQHKDQYVKPKKPALVEVPPIPYLAIEGKGEPGGERFQACVGALYGAAFTIKMTRKFAGQGDYKVCGLEGLWCIEGGDWNAAKGHPEKLQWKLIIRVPDFITKADLDDAKKQLRAKKKPPEFEDVRLETIKEGACVQVLHVGPYDQEEETIAAMRAFAEENGLTLAGPHHEIYLSDPRRVAPEKLKTILRQPVKAK
jgi:hypothetical protein